MSQERLLEELQALSNELDTLRVAVKAQSLDLEATQRERDALAKALGNMGYGVTWLSHPRDGVVVEVRRV